MTIRCDEYGVREAFREKKLNPVDDVQYEKNRVRKHAKEETHILDLAPALRLFGLALPVLALGNVGRAIV